eukprot:3072418-Rhodomonas_salina.2
MSKLKKNESQEGFREQEEEEHDEDSDSQKEEDEAAADDGEEGGDDPEWRAECVSTAAAERDKKRRRDENVFRQLLTIWNPASPFSDSINVSEKGEMLARLCEEEVTQVNQAIQSGSTYQLREAARRSASIDSFDSTLPDTSWL